MEQEREGEEERQHRGVFAEKRDGSGMKASQWCVRLTALKDQEVKKKKKATYSL